MSKYIDADLYVEMQIYDDEHEEWIVWKGTIEDLLNQWTERGCPPIIDCISREYILSFLDGEFMGDDDYIAGMNDEQREIREVVRNAPSVVSSAEPKRGKWIHEELIPNSITGHMHAECSNCHKVRIVDNFCPNCGARMESDGE